ncbi:MAG: 3-oxoacyl-ACP reductase FabG [Gammaproteobacteria bacterium]|nr:MAG: 3-oxoacyl-ACP reductase FabG [Gammaproteobacteria bacterium]
MIKNKTRSILLTGASGALGQAMARRLAQSGFTLSLHYRSNEETVNRLISELATIGDQPHRQIQFSADDRMDCKTAIDADIAQFGAYYGVVCNAGIIRDNAFPAMTGEEWDSVLRTNLDGFYNILHPTMMPMVRKKQGGRIVTIASVSGIMGNRGQTNYSASKGGIIAATKALALELGKRKITVNCVAPGIIDTEMTSTIDETIVKQMIPLGRMGSTDEVASLVNYLLSDEASYITRQVISVNGGMC